ncbi:MAG TPA: molybdenum cofactor biosynthesis protein MoaE [Gemmatimonadaceae bacterium]|nr:molybdenum cofactor biosynthesis protein MoaE [Gemmatimonadaceae bacterium]
MRAAIVHGAIDVAALLAEVASASHGATVLFIGTVRDVNDERAVTGIDYTAYVPMAEREMQRILREAAERFDTDAAVVEHRTGHLELGDASVAIAVAHARRAQAYAASRYILEALKQRVPIWKREAYADGTREWVAQQGAMTAHQD